MADNELVSFLISQGHSEERAQQIAENHPDAVRADLEAKAATPPEVESTPDVASIREFFDHALRDIHARIDALESRHERLVDHVNRELGVAGDAPVIERIRALEAKPDAQPAAVAAPPAPVAPADAQPAVSPLEPNVAAR